MNFTIREAQESDLPDIVSLWSAFMEMLPQINNNYWDVKDGRQAFQKYLKFSLEKQDVLVTLAENETDNLVGFSLSLIEELPEWFGSEKIGLIRYQAVAAKFHGKGVGQAMTDFIFSWFRKRNIRRVELYVLEGLAASDYWLKIGFKTFMDRRFIII